MSTKKKSSELEIDPNRTYKFKLTSSHEGKYIIPSKSYCWDVDAKKQREIRLSPLSETPYVDDQPEGAPTFSGTLEFNAGQIILSGKEPYKINYLLAHDGNSGKGKDILPTNRHLRYRYELIDDAEQFKSKAKLRKLKLEMQNAISGATKEEIADFLLATYGYSPITKERDELEEIALSKIDEDVTVVKNNFKTEAVKLKSKIINLFKENVLRNEKGVITWVEGGLEVNTFTVTEDNKLVDQMVDWVGKDSKEAKAFVKKLSSL